MNNYLLLDGSNSMTGNLSINKSNSSIFIGNEESTHIYSDIRCIMNEDEKTIIRTQIQGTQNTYSLIDRVLFINKTGGIMTQYRLFGEHNKPYGTYKGTGSSDETVIEITSGYKLSSAVIIIGNGFTTIVSYSGGLIMKSSDTTITKLLKSEIYYYNGVISIATDNTAVNASGISYTYNTI